MAALSVGNLLLEHTLEQSCCEGIATLEFGYGANPYKDAWASSSRSVCDITIYGSGPVGRTIATVKARHVRTLP